MDELLFIMTGGRGSGKTAAIIRWMLEDPENRCVIVGDSNRRRHLIQRLRESGLKIKWEEHVVITPSLRHFQGVRTPYLYRQVAVDDLDYILQFLFGNSVELATLNGTWVPLAEPDKPIKADVIQNELEMSTPFADIEELEPFDDNSQIY